MASSFSGCFRPTRIFDHASDTSSSVASSVPEPPAGDDMVIYGEASTVIATKQRLKRLLRKDDKNERALMNRDPEFRTLAKLFGEESAIGDLSSLAGRFPDSLLSLLPFFLNMLLYGFGDDVDERSRKFKEQVQSAAKGRKKASREDNATALGTAAQLQARGKSETELEDFVYSLCQRSVVFALNSSWYFTSSLILGPPEMYHRTMTLLLGLESAVTTDKKPGDLFKRSEIEGPQTLETSDHVLSPRRRGKNHKANTMTTIQSSTAPPQVATPSTPKENALDVDLASEPEANEITDVVLDSTGDGTDIHLQFKGIDQQEKVKLQMWLSEREDRGNFFHSQLDFIKCLTDISRDLFEVPREHRREALRTELEKLNQYLPKNVFLPTDSRPHRILRIVSQEAFPFSTKERCPYGLVLEVEDIPGDDEADAPRDSKKARRRRSVHLEEKNYAAEKFTYQSNVADSNMLMELESKRSLEDKDLSTSSVVREQDEVFGESWSAKSERLRNESPHGANPHWRLTAAIVKAKDKLRQEMFAGSLVKEFARIYKAGKVPLWVFPYGILATSADSGLIEFLIDAKSIDSIKKHAHVTSLADFFVKKFGERDSAAHKKAVRNFTESMAGYSVICYVLQIKDRHNGNLMLDSHGHIVHIDFGFLLSNSPGGNFEFEKAPFKLSAEMLEVMGGPQSNTFKRFRKLCNKGYMEVCKHRTKLLLMVDMFYHGNEGMPCFMGGRDAVLEQLRDRLSPGTSSKEKKAFFNRQINASIDNWTTKWYDRYQKCFTGIA